MVLFEYAKLTRSNALVALPVGTASGTDEFPEA